MVNNNTYDEVINKLDKTIYKNILKYGWDGKEIRVRIGISLCYRLEKNNRLVFFKYPTHEEITILGYPVDIDYKNKECLEVHVVEKII